MDFEWDESKNERCYQIRGFDFEYASQIFSDPHRIILIDDREDYGETRYVITGKIAERLFVVVYTARSTKVRIISARKANSREVKDYETYHHHSRPQ